ncbi:coiled-coil domain-containing protein 86 [Diabrotica undecimpunctata]|uniref:coiled-coil domain-containing protein 86 n=1 Tax=Diabrotica undecimpunctata TaxID=50387 RepID=UPI003B640F94
MAKSEQKEATAINTNDLSAKTRKTRSGSKPEAVPRGKPKSGRIWKSERKKFSSVIKTKGIKSSFERKEALRQKLKQVKELTNSLKAAKQEEKEKKKERRRANLKKQEENRLKSEVVQVITNTKKLKKTKKKHLRNIEKRDTTVVSK